MTDMFATGVVHGRFQPLHKGHLDYIKDAKLQCSFLYIGIANPDPCLTEFNVNSPHRSLAESNPFSYHERLRMIRLSLEEIGLRSDEYEVVPFPVNKPELLFHYVPLDSVFFITIYDGWGMEKKRILEGEGLEVVVLEEGDEDLKVASGTHIRSLMKNDKNWKEHVPSATVDYLESLLSRGRFFE